MFESKRLIYRGLEESDLASLKAALNSADYMRNASPGPLAPVSNERIKVLMQSRSGKELPIFAVCLKPEAREADDDEKDSGGNLPMIGVIHFQNQRFDYKNRTCTLGFGLHQAKHRGKGFGTEMMEWTLQYGFIELALHRIELVCYSHNTAAIKIYQKTGFIEEGRGRKTTLAQGKWSDTLHYGMLETDWQEMQK